MGLVHKLLIQTSMLLKGRDDIKLYNTFMKEANLPLEVLQQRQLEQFKKIFIFAKETFPYYDNLFSKLKLHHTDFKTLTDLEKIPILTKKIILENAEGFNPRKSVGRFVWASTGGSTGAPLKYRLGQECNTRDWALNWRGYSKADFEIGDKLIVFGGGSIIRDEVSYKSKIRLKILNCIPLFSYGMTKDDLYKFYKIIQESKAQFIYGYASSIALLAQYMEQNNLILDNEFKGIFSTSEMLTPAFRSIIEKVFRCKVFNSYGMNDGGLSASEDKNGCMTIDTERAILEIVDENGVGQEDISGRIIATSLYNYPFPFLRYDTSDIGTLSAKFKSKGYSRLVLTELLGRTTDYINLNGRIIGSPVLTVLMSKISAHKYQFIQLDDKNLELRIDKSKDFTKEQEDYIIKSLKSNIGDNFNLSIKYGEEFLESGNKHKFIINKNNKVIL